MRTEQRTEHRPALGEARFCFRARGAAHAGSTPIFPLAPAPDGQHGAENKRAPQAGRRPSPRAKQPGRNPSARAGQHKPAENRPGGAAILARTRCRLRFVPAQVGRVPRAPREIARVGRASYRRRAARQKRILLHFSRTGRAAPAPLIPGRGKQAAAVAAAYPDRASVIERMERSPPPRAPPAGIKPAASAAKNPSRAEPQPGPGTPREGRHQMNSVETGLSS